MTTAMINEAYNPTIGSTPAMIENEIASGINASATTIPANIFVPGAVSHSFFNLFSINCAPLLKVNFNSIAHSIKKVYSTL